MHQLGQITPLVVAVNEHGDEERPHHRDRRRLGGSEDASEDAAKDDDHGHQAPHRFTGDFQRGAQRDHFTLGVVASARKDHAQAHHHCAEQQPRHDPGHKQRSDRYRAARCQRVQHRVVAGRGEQSLYRAANRYRRGELTGVTGALHFRNQYRAHGSGVGDGRAGNRAKEGRGDDIDQRQAAAHKPYQYPGKGHQPT